MAHDCADLRLLILIFLCLRLNALGPVDRAVARVPIFGGKVSPLPIIGGRQNRLTLGIKVRPLLDWQNLIGDKTPYSVHLRLGSRELRPLIKRNQPRMLGPGLNIHHRAAAQGEAIFGDFHKAR